MIELAHDVVVLQCPKCNRRMKVKRDESDPPGTSLVVLQCPACNGGDFDEAAYFADDGKEIHFAERATLIERDALP